MLLKSILLPSGYFSLSLYCYLNTMLMNTIITPAIIARLEAEVCPTHGQKAELFVENDIFSVTKSCCPEFEKHLYDLCSELIDGSDRANALLEQMFGLR